MVSSPHDDVDVRDVRCSFFKKICACNANSFKSQLLLTKSRFKTSITIHHHDRPSRTVCQPRQNWGEADRSSQQKFSTSKTYTFSPQDLSSYCANTTWLQRFQESLSRARIRTYTGKRWNEWPLVIVTIVTENITPAVSKRQW